MLVLGGLGILHPSQKKAMFDMSPLSIAVVWASSLVLTRQVNEVWGCGRPHDTIVPIKSASQYGRHRGMG